MPFCHNCLRDVPANECHSHCNQHPFASEASRLRAQVLDLERDRKELRRVLCTLVPRLIETECECSDDGLCDKHLVEVTLANFPKF